MYKRILCCVPRKTQCARKGKMYSWTLWVLIGAVRRMKKLILTICILPIQEWIPFGRKSIHKCYILTICTAIISKLFHHSLLAATKFLSTHANIHRFIFLWSIHMYDWSSSIFIPHTNGSSHTPHFRDHCCNEQKNQCQQNKHLPKIFAMNIHAKILWAPSWLLQLSFCS